MVDGDGREVQSEGSNPEEERSLSERNVVTPIQYPGVGFRCVGCGGRPVPVGQFEHVSQSRVTREGPGGNGRLSGKRMGGSTGRWTGPQGRGGHGNVEGTRSRGRFGQRDRFGRDSEIGKGKTTLS